MTRGTLGSPLLFVTHTVKRERRVWDVAVIFILFLSAGSADDLSGVARRRYPMRPSRRYTSYSHRISQAGMRSDTSM